MNKQSLILAVAIASSQSKAVVASVLEAVTNEVAKNVREGESVDIAGFGSFKAVAKPARTGRNPATGAAVQIAAKNAVKFVPAKALKDSINE